jgi:RNA polymerase sigma factor (sigma-70 family)
MTSEIELLQASLNGSSDAFEAIVRKYQSLICAITYSATGDLDKSEELAQQAFINAWKNLAQLKDLASFRTWLCSIARSIIRNYFRGKKRDIISHAAPIQDVAGTVPDDFEPVEAAIGREQQEVIRQALQQIPESYREPLVLFYREQKSLKQVAEQLQLSEGAARQRISRGRSVLKEQVAAMVETTLSRNGPTTAFTAAVVASIVGMAIETSGAAAATASTTGVTGTGAAVTAAASGLTAKIITVAAVLTIGTAAVVTYKHVTSKAKPPEYSDTVPTIAQPDTSAAPPRIDAGKDITPDDIPAKSKTATAPETMSPPRNIDTVPTPPQPETREFVSEPEGAHSGQLKPWEIAYYKAGIERICRCWTRTAKKAGRGRDGRINEPYPIYLVIDSLKPAMWLETAGQIDPNHCTELPKNMKWKLYRTSPDGNEDLRPVIRLKIRGLRMSQTFPEKVCAHSYGRGPGHFSIYITAPNVSTNYGPSGTFVIATYKGQFTEGVDYFDSIVVGEKEYAESIESVKGLENEIAQLKSDVDSELPRNLANWLEAEKQLYMQIERQLLMTGLEVLKMRVTAGPDCTAGHAEVSVLEYSAFENRLRRSSPAWVYLKIDHLGEDVWYLRSDANPEGGLESVMRPDESLQLDRPGVPRHPAERGHRRVLRDMQQYQWG